MRNLAFIVFSAAIFFGCGNSSQKQAREEVATVLPEKETVVFTVDGLYANATENVDKEVVVKGTVMHVCKEGGARCFLMGSNENINIRVEAGEKIGAFNQEQMGSDLEIIGILKEVKSEADTHNPRQHEGVAQAGEDTDVATAHKVIAESQDNVETVYFIEGVKVREL